jgi:cell division protein FtsB
VRELSPPIQPSALERAAREQLGFVRQDEVLFKFE